MSRRFSAAFLAILVGGLISISAVGLVVASVSSSLSPSSASAPGASTPASFVSTEDWSVELAVRATPPSGVFIGGEPDVLFGVREFCRTDLFETFQIGGVQSLACDEARVIFLGGDQLEAFFDNPDGGEAVTAGIFDNTQLIRARHSPGAGDVTGLTWPLRIELGTLVTPSGVPAGTYTLTISWLNAEVASIPDIPLPRTVELLEGTPDSPGPVVVDMRLGTAEDPAWSCTDDGTTTSCSTGRRSR